MTKIFLTETHGIKCYEVRVPASEYAAYLKAPLPQDEAHRIVVTK